MTEPRRILIVEDEPLIAMMLEDFLDMQGHAIVGTADCVADAMPLIEDNTIDAAVLDVNLRGGEKSWPIAAALAERDIPFVLATGGHSETVDDRFRNRPTLTKPFTMDSVAEAVAALG